ncbi:MAG: diguanylate cyclase [Cereibacter sp.]|jgi:diguanylate cyclase (GGDEF)-like protein|nr:diguanylate cyclase [Cereibacter sp.]
MTRRFKTHAFPARLIALIATAAALALLSVVLVARQAVREVDADAFAHQRAFVERAVQTEAERIPVEQRASTHWDEAVLRSRANDQDWMDDNLGLWMQDFYGHDRSYVLGPDDRPIYGAVDGRRLDPEIPLRLDGRLAELASRLRALIAETQAAEEDPAEAVAELSFGSTVLLEGQPVLVSITPIMPDTDGVTQAAGEEYLHVAVQYLDDTLARRIGEADSLRDAAFVRQAPEGEAKLALHDAGGAPLVWFTWTPDQPGLRLVQTMKPVVTLFGLFCLGLFVALVVRLWFSARYLQRSEAEARYLASHDALAGLPNRMHFEERLADALPAARAGGARMALISVDLDHFKKVNDTLGHAAGDELIRQVSSRMLAQVRRSDTVARLGGDEFGIILIGMAEGEALATFCAGLVHLLSLPYQLQAGLVQVSASIGVATAEEVGGGVEALQRAADAALYRAKLDGRSRFCIFTEAMDDGLRRRHEIERDLRLALAAGDQFDVHYQPILDRDGSLFAAEALLRWPGAPGGPVSPELFIAVAEESGMIEELGLWVLREACAFAQQMALPKISVNVSAVQLRSARFTADVLAVLEDTGLPPERLELELTERCALDSGAATHRNLKDLRAAGVMIALDDFATGHSLLQYVRDFDIDVIKIDQSFVSRLGSVDGTDQVVRALVDLGHAMGLEIIAEGVETEAQREALIGIGCHIFQGYLLGRPLSREAFRGAGFPQAGERPA